MNDSCSRNTSVIPVTKDIQEQVFRSHLFKGKQPAERSLPLGVIRERCFEQLLLRFDIALRRLQNDFWRCGPTM